MGNLYVSVIIPIYNTHIDNFSVCVDSLLMQSYSNFELIVVDDGSQNEYAFQYDTLQEKDNRIKVFHKDNEGVSSARNFGVEKCSGDYLMFVDSDDILSPYALQEAVKSAEKENADFIFSGIKHIKNYEDFAKYQMPSTGEKVFCKEQMNYLKESFLSQSNPIFKNINGVGAFVNRGPYARLVKVDIARKVLFDTTLKIGEDVEWNFRILSNCNKAVFVSSVWYGYLIHGESSLHRYYGNREELLRMYQQKLYDNNKDFCDAHISAYLKNLSVNFYTVMQYDFMSKKCPLNTKQKNKLLKQYLSSYPWEQLVRKNNFNKLNIRYKVLIGFANIGQGMFILKLWRLLKLPS